MRLRFMELDAEIAEGTRAWLVEGIPTPRARLAEQWAEHKKLTVELHKLNEVLRAEKGKALLFKQCTLMTFLFQKLESMGLQHLIDEATKQSLEALTEAGLMPAYKAKN